MNGRLFEKLASGIQKAPQSCENAFLVTEVTFRLVLRTFVHAGGINTAAYVGQKAVGLKPPSGNRIEMQSLLIYSNLSIEPNFGNRDEFVFFANALRFQ